MAAAVADAPEEESQVIEATTPRVDLAQLVNEILGPEEEPVTLGALPEPRKPWAAVLDGRARITSGYGMRKDPFTGAPEFHEGVDLAAKTGTPITAYQSGVVSLQRLEIRLWPRRDGGAMRMEAKPSTHTTRATASPPGSR